MAELTPVAPAHPPLRWLFPVQSSGQALSVAVLFIVFGFGMLLLLRLTGGHASAWILLPGLAGMLPSMYLALPGAFEIRSRGQARQLVGDVEEIAAFLGYRVRIEELPGLAWRYRLNHPAWMRWRENEITVRVLGEQRIAIRGPKGALRMLRKHLAQRVGSDPAARA